MDKLVIAIDVGGTTIKVGIVQEKQVLARDSILSYAEHGMAARLADLGALIETLCGQCGVEIADCAGIAMGLPFLVDPGAGRILSAPKDKFGDAAEIDLKSWAENGFGLPLKIENDAHAALLGEWVHGAGKGSDDLVMITLGTGIGCSVIMRGRPLRGKHFQAGVLGGHVIADPEGTPCPVCPAVGCYETESGSLSLPRLAKADHRFSTSALSTEATIDYAAVFRLATAGDALAVHLRDRAICYWSALAVTLIHAYNPDSIIVGGAVSRDADIILPAMQDYVNRHAWVTAPVALCAAELGTDAGLIGAATLFQKEIQCL